METQNLKDVGNTTTQHVPAAAELSGPAATDLDERLNALSAAEDQPILSQHDSFVESLSEQSAHKESSKHAPGGDDKATTQQLITQNPNRRFRTWRQWKRSLKFLALVATGIVAYYQYLDQLIHSDPL